MDKAFEPFQGLGSLGCPVDPLEIGEQDGDVPAFDRSPGGPEPVRVVLHENDTTLTLLDSTTSSGVR